MINTILFDLDGTLLPMDTQIFTERYFKELSVKLKDYFTPEEVTKHMWGSTEYMINSKDIDKTNQEVFFDDFYKNVKHSEEILNPIFDDFYENDFNNIKDVSERNEDMIESVKLLKQKGYDMVIATNPLFPKSAMLNRVKWAGLKEEDFIFITSFEEMHYAKPNIKFYEEILEKVDKEPSECLMVGNDIAEDMVVKEIGITTYLITDYAVGDIKDKNIDYSGNYKKFYEFAKEMPDLNEK